MTDNVEVFTDDNFEKNVLAADKPVLVDFWAPWCNPCQAIAPHIESLAAEMSDKVIFGKVNVDNCASLVANYGVRSIPALLLFKSGKPVDQLIGAVSKASIADMINKHL